MGRRTVLLVAAILVAALGTTLVFLYVNGINDRAIADQQPTRVLVAKSLIALGTKGSDAAAAGAFEQKTLPHDAVAPGAIDDVKPIADLVAKGPIYPGEQIILDKFGAPGSTGALPIPDGKVAVSVQLSDPARVAGFVAPGSKVAVYVTVTVKDVKSADASLPPVEIGGQKLVPTTQGKTKDIDFTGVLLPSAEVVAVGQTTVVPVKKTDASGNEQTEQIPKTILTLALDQDQAQKLVYASQKGELYFALVGKTKVEKHPLTIIDNLFD
jgi:pilus assembly protein CpaB